MTQARLLFNGKYLNLCERDGWEYAERTTPGGAVIICCVNADDEVVLVEQYRKPIECRTIEMPAGLVGDLDDSETVELAARRELLEETGHTAESIRFLMRGPSSAGMSTETMSFVRATGLQRVGPGGGDASEDIRVHLVARTECARWLEARRAEGYSIDPKLYAGLYFLSFDPDGTPVKQD